MPPVPCRWVFFHRQGTGGEYAQVHLQGWICSPARRFLTAARQGELNWADGLIVPQICDTMRGLKGL